MRFKLWYERDRTLNNEFVCWLKKEGQDEAAICHVGHSWEEARTKAMRTARRLVAESVPCEEEIVL